jgi:hypothetical protein
VHFSLLCAALGGGLLLHMGDTHTRVLGFLFTCFMVATKANNAGGILDTAYGSDAFWRSGAGACVSCGTMQSSFVNCQQTKPHPQSTRPNGSMG